MCIIHIATDTFVACESTEITIAASCESCQRTFLDWQTNVHAWMVDPSVLGSEEVFACLGNIHKNICRLIAYCMQHLAFI